MQIPLTFTEAKCLTPEQLISRLRAMTFPEFDPEDAAIMQADSQAIPHMTIDAWCELTSTSLNEMRDSFITRIETGALTDEFIQRFVDQQLFWLCYNYGKASRWEKASSGARTKAERYAERNQIIIDYIRNSNKRDMHGKINDLLAHWEEILPDYSPPSPKTIRNILSQNR